MISSFAVYGCAGWPAGFFAGVVEANPHPVAGGLNAGEFGIAVAAVVHSSSMRTAFQSAGWYFHRIMRVVELTVFRHVSSSSISFILSAAPSCRSPRLAPAV